MSGRMMLLLAAVFVAAVPLHASVVGTNPPAESLTRERVMRLPAAERGPWLAYLERSRQQRQADKDSFAAELKKAGIAVPIEPPHGNSAKSIPLDKDAAWYASVPARHIADVIVSFQTPAGGWGKNMDMSRELRQPGEKFGPNNLSRFLAPNDFDTPAEPDWNYIGTIDNDATTTQLNFLAKVIAAGGDSVAYRAVFQRGIEYLLHAQYPNGGWPQVWPLEGGYHDAITFNDDAVTQVVELLHGVAEGKGNFAFAPAELRARAKKAFELGIHCILAAQLKDKSGLTVWPQQSDALTLEPVSARNFEPPTPCSDESAAIVLLLMNVIDYPEAAVQGSIRAAAAWFQKTAIYGQSWQRGANGRQLVADPKAGPIWSRYSQSGSNLPVFGDRDKSIHDNVNELTLERRNGYSWFNAEPKQALERFATWSKEHPEHP